MASAPKPKRTEAFEAGQAPLTMADLSPKEQKVAVSLVSDVSKSTRANLRKTAQLITKPNAKKPDIQKGMKAKAALKDAVDKPYRPDEAVESRIAYITKAATQHRLPAQEIEHRDRATEHIPAETVGGSGFYFQGRGEVDDMLKGTDVSSRTALHASAKLSVKTKPNLEKEALRALIPAHQSGTVHFSPELVDAMNNMRDLKTGKTVVTVPESHKGTMRFSDVDPAVASELTNPQVRELAKSHVSGVNLDSLSKTSMRGNLAEAHRMMQGGQLNPYTNPKQVSYASAHEISSPGTPVEEEYKVRSQHIGRVLRGEVDAGQQMFDFTGLQDSNEGALSNRAFTPADLHERRVSYAQPGKAFTAAPESNVLGTKKRTLPSGKVEGVGLGDARIKPIAIEHAVHQDAVHRTADELQRRLGLPFTVPATFVQETNWAGQRRDEGDDDLYTAARRMSENSRSAATKKRNSSPGIEPLF
ncbi:hypothetical protein UFOVP221_5 [uncultured Caudovirales phage]|uniref:Uncharacterized protein n=1 Tax=uncultured Caudovirales phage TaxID=2100421 RepID=A0A6J7WLF2_9CAUD|nr:hypothetical protein UFOVP221_5 [uncultured Caudovirales phage]